MHFLRNAEEQLKQPTLTHPNAPSGTRNHAESCVNHAAAWHPIEYVTLQAEAVLSYFDTQTQVMYNFSEDITSLQLSYNNDVYVLIYIERWFQQKHLSICYHS